MRIQKIILLLIVIFTSKISSGQEIDSLKEVVLKKLKSDGYFKEIIHEFKSKELPSFELNLLNGNKLNSETLKGKPTVINFWFSNCTPCVGFPKNVGFPLLGHL